MIATETEAQSCIKTISTARTVLKKDSKQSDSVLGKQSWKGDEQLHCVCTAAMSENNCPVRDLYVNYALAMPRNACGHVDPCFIL